MIGLNFTISASIGKKMQKYFHKSDKVWLLIDSLLGLLLLALAVCGLCLYSVSQEAVYSLWLIFLCSLLICIAILYLYIPLVIFVYDRNTYWNYNEQSGVIHYVNDFTGDISFHIDRIKLLQPYEIAWLWISIEYYRLILDDETEILISSVTREPSGINKLNNGLSIEKIFLFQHFPIHIIKYYRMGRWLKHQKKQKQACNL